MYGTTHFLQDYVLIIYLHKLHILDYKKYQLCAFYKYCYLYFLYNDSNLEISDLQSI